MSIAAADFKIRFPEFGTEIDERIELFISDSGIIINEVYWAEKYNLGLYYLTAHYIALANKSAAGSTQSVGAIASKSVEGVSVAYAKHIPDNQSDAYYDSTSYGQRYLAMRKTLGVAACVI